MKNKGSISLDLVILMALIIVLLSSIGQGIFNLKKILNINKENNKITIASRDEENEFLMEVEKNLIDFIKDKDNGKQELNKKSNKFAGYKFRNEKYELEFVDSKNCFKVKTLKNYKEAYKCTYYSYIEKQDYILFERRCFFNYSYE